MINKEPSAFLILGILLLSSMSPGQDDEFSRSQERGKEIYQDHCMTCHLEDGTGTSGIFPPLAQSDYLEMNISGSIKAIKFGQDGEVAVNGISYNSIMPAQAMSDQEIADVMNYIQNAWGNKGKYIKPAEIARIKQ